MLILQYFSFFLYLQICDLFVLLDIPSSSNVLNYHEEKSFSSRTTNSYYTIQNSSSSLIDFMRTLYEQEKQDDKQLDYNLIRALAPRIGKNIL